MSTKLESYRNTDNALVDTFDISQPVSIYNGPISDIFQEKLEPIPSQKWESDQEHAFFVADLGEVIRQHVRWKSLLPRIEPFYAVKCNPDPMIIKFLATLGCNFDCASKQELQQVLEAGVDGSRIIYANPCKQASYICYAAQQNVNHMTFDNAEELFKIKNHHPNAKLVLRIATDDSMAVYPLGVKFGAPLHTIQYLLQTAKDLGLNVIGVSFHVGSGCFNEKAFITAVECARAVFDRAEQMGYDFKFLDVGGGFPGFDSENSTSFANIAKVLSDIVDRLFPKDVRVIAEPGRYYVASAFTLAVNIIGRRSIMPPDGNSKDPFLSELSNDQYMYYVNDGKHGSFSFCILLESLFVKPKVLKRGKAFLYGQELKEDLIECSVWGPTCDPLDCLNESTLLPKLEPGDWLYYEKMGAYTISAASQFNGFRKLKIIYTNTFL